MKPPLTDVAGCWVCWVCQQSHVHAHDEDVKAGERRKAAGAHASVVPSAAGAAPGRGRSYTFGAQRAFRAMPSWRSGV